MSDRIGTVRAVSFSPTGSTRRVLRSIAAGIGAARVQEDSLDRPAWREAGVQVGADELLLVGMPVYAGRVPGLFHGGLPVRGTGDAVCVVCYGNRNYDDALIELRDILQQDGFRCVAAGAFVGEHSFSRTLGAGRPDDGDMAGQAAFAREICEKLAGQAGTENTPVAVRGETPIRPYYTPRDRHGNPINILKVKPKTDPDRCGGCGLCAELCPMGSIDPADVSQVRGICIKCCACVKKCPSGAKYFDDPGYLFHQHELEDVYTRRAENEWFV